MDLDWIKFRQHVAWRRGVPPAKAERQVVWLDAEGTTFGKPTDEPLARRRFSAEDIVNAVRRTAERERLERLRADIENGG